MIELGLRQLQEALNRKANEVQKEFIAVSERLKVIGLQLVETREEEHDRLLKEQEDLRRRQLDVAEEVNIWRERARQVTLKGEGEALRKYLHQVLAASDDTLRPIVQRTLRALEAPDDFSGDAAAYDLPSQPATGAARLIERARTEYDLRGPDPAHRHRAALEFSQRRGMAQDDAVVAQIEGALADPDPIVREVVLLTTIQLHRFRALNVADLDVAHESVKRLARIDNVAVIPVLIEILSNPRSGFVGDKEEKNGNSRMLALTRLIEWHTASALTAVQARRFDPDPRIVRVAMRALELFPAPWEGPLPRAPSVAA